MLRRLWSISPAIVFGAAFLVLTRFVRRTPTIPREISVDQALTARAPASLIDVSQAVDVQHWVFVVLALAVCLVLARRFRQALLLLFAELLADGLNLALKIAINRQFPDQGPVLGWDRLDTLLFPSGHVVRTTVTLGLLVGFIAWPHARWRWPPSIAALAVVALVSVTQVTVGGHLPLDALGGFLLGGCLVNLVYMADRAWAGRVAAPLNANRRPRVIVTEVPSQQPRWELRPALAPPIAAVPQAERTAGRAAHSRSRALPAVGLAMMLVIVAFGVRAPQRLWHFAADPTSATSWPWVLVTDAGRHAQSVRAWISQVHRGG